VSNQGAISAIECTQKLDLLVHIITNRQNCLILKGKQGVGKSTFLNAALKRKTNKHELYLIKANGKMSFEVVQTELLSIISASYQLDAHHSIADVLEIYAKEGKHLILLIDDAGCLVTGVISTLITYANQYKALCLVFALTPSEYDEKQKIEKIESSCQIIVLPGLTLKQTELLIDQLAALGNTAYTRKEIDATFVQKIYNITQGNPHEIKQLILSTKKNNFNHLIMMVGAVLIVAIFSIVINSYLWNESEQSSKKELTTHSSAVAKLKVPRSVEQHTLKQVQKIQSITLEQKGVDATVLKKMVLPVDEEIKSSSVIASGVSKPKKRIAVQGGNSPVVKVADELEKKVKPTILVTKVTALDEINQFKSHQTAVLENSDQWILAKKGTDYTLQLMVLSVKEKLLVAQKKYLKLGYKTFYITKKTEKSLGYILFYGYFATLAEAKMQAKKLPKELRKAWPRKISVIQKQIQSNISVNIREGEKRK